MCSKWARTPFRSIFYSWERLSVPNLEFIVEWNGVYWKGFLSFQAALQRKSHFPKKQNFNGQPVEVRSGDQGGICRGNASEGWFLLRASDEMELQLVMQKGGKGGKFHLNWIHFICVCVDKIRVQASCKYSTVLYGPACQTFYQVFRLLTGRRRTSKRHPSWSREHSYNWC